MRFFYFKNLNKEKGFTLLMAIIIALVLLTIGTGIINISVREFRLALVSTESAKALGLADMGVDCAFHHDIRTSLLTPHTPTPFPSPTIVPTTVLDITIPNTPSVFPQTIRCNGQDLDIIVSKVEGPITEYTYTFSNLTVPAVGANLLIDPVNNNSKCVEITVKKILDSSIIPAGELTSISGRGSSTCGTSGNKVERAFCLSWESRDYRTNGGIVEPCPI